METLKIVLTQAIEEFEKLKAEKKMVSDDYEEQLTMHIDQRQKLAKAKAECRCLKYQNARLQERVFKLSRQLKLAT